MESDSDSKRRLEGIVASAMDAIITLDEQNRIVLFNPAAERMFGVQASEVVGQSISRFIPDRYRAKHDEHIGRFREAGVTDRRMGALGAVSGVRANGEEFPVEASISQVNVGGERLATVILRDITERKLNEEARVLLAREVDHRAKNALAVAQSLVRLTTAPTIEDYVRAVQGRIAALARAHSLLSKSSWQGADLGQTISDELEAYSKPGQVTIEGPSTMLLANAVQPVSLVMHELATNAFKYGALAIPDGRVEISWSPGSNGRLLITWRESGGPPVLPPTRRGFGSTLLHEVVTRQLEGDLDIDWRPDGVRAELQLGPPTFRIEPDVRPVQRPAGVVRGGSDRGKGRQVLVVEDESLIAMELHAELTRAGWTVIGPAQSLNEALKLVEDTSAIQAAVLDVNLGGRAVYPVAEILQSQGLPFVFCTGYEMVDPEGRFPDAPVLRKPVNVDLLNRELNAQLSRRTVPAQ